MSTATELPRPGEWSIQWRGNTYGEADVTGQHLAVLALIAGSDDFESLDIDPRHGDADEDDIAGQVAHAVAEVSAASVDEILGALRFG